MALIKCPNCNAEISDQAEMCVHCNYLLNNTCKECGKPLDNGALVCSNCGCPVGINTQQVPQKIEVAKENVGKKTKRKIVVFILIFFALALISVSVFLAVKNFKDKQYDSMYKLNLQLIVTEMLNGGAEAEKCINMISKVWYNSIFEKSDEETDKYTKKNGRFNNDFNDSLNNYFSSIDYTLLKQSIDSNFADVSSKMMSLHNPSDKYKEAYNRFLQYYKAYVVVNSLCLGPTGSYQTYITDSTNAEKAMANGYEALRPYI